MKIRHKISSGFLISFLFILFCSAMSTLSINSMKNEMNLIKISSIPQLENSSEVLVDIDSIMNISRAVLTIDMEKEFEEFKAKRDELSKTFVSLDNFMREWGKVIRTGFEVAGRNITEEETFETLTVRIKGYRDNAEQFFRLYDKGDKSSRSFFEESLKPAMEEVKKLAWEIQYREYNKINEKMQRIRETAISNFQIMFMVIVISLFTLLTLSYLLSRNISRPISELKLIASEIGFGNLEVELSAGGNDEFGQLCTTMQQMTLNLRKDTVSRQYFDKVAKLVSDGLLVVKNDGVVLYANSSLCNLLGYMPGEIIGKSFRTVLTPGNEDSMEKPEVQEPQAALPEQDEEPDVGTSMGDPGESEPVDPDENTDGPLPGGETLPRHWFELEALVKNGFIRNLEISLFARNGKEFSMSLSGEVVLDRDGNLERVICVFSDLSKQKMLEKKLVQLQDAFKGIVESVPQGILVMDLNGVVNFANTAALRMLGRKKEEVLHRNIGLKLVPGLMTYMKINSSEKNPEKGLVISTETRWMGVKSCLISITPVPDRES